MRLGYLYSRYPVLSQTFYDAEMLALERLGFELEIGSVYPPLTSLRHEHIHVHFANRAAHTAMFLKEISGIPFSVTAHGQDFMKDLGNDDLLREICAAAEFVAAETDYSRDLLRQRCPDSAAKIHRVYNGMDLTRFPAPDDETAHSTGPSRTGTAPYHVPRITSTGRLVAFKGFEYL